MLLDLGFKLKDIKGIELEFTAYDTVNNILTGQTVHLSPLKAYGFAVKLESEKGKIEIDRVDLELLLKEIEDSKTLTNLSKGQLIICIKEMLLKN